MLSITSPDATKNLHGVHMNEINKAKGYILLYRSLLEHPFSNKPEIMWLWIVMLLKATYQERKINWCGKPLSLKPGQFITSYQSLSIESGISLSKIRTAFKWFKQDKQISTQISSYSSLVTITNWKDYQQLNKPIASQSQPLNKPIASNNEVIKSNKVIVLTPADENFCRTILEDEYICERFGIEKYKLRQKIEVWRSAYPRENFELEFIKYRDFAEFKPKGLKWKTFYSSFTAWLEPKEWEKPKEEKIFYDDGSR